MLCPQGSLAASSVCDAVAERVKQLEAAARSAARLGAGSSAAARRSASYGIGEEDSEDSGSGSNGEDGSDDDNEHVCCRPGDFFLLIRRSHSIGFTRALGIPKYKIGFGMLHVLRAFLTALLGWTRVHGGALFPSLPGFRVSRLPRVAALCLLRSRHLNGPRCTDSPKTLVACGLRRTGPQARPTPGWRLLTPASRPCKLRPWRSPSASSEEHIPRRRRLHVA